MPAACPIEQPVVVPHDYSRTCRSSTARPCQANGHGQASGDHASSRIDPDGIERLTGIYGSEGHGGYGLSPSGRSSGLQPAGHAVPAGWTSAPATRATKLPIATVAQLRVIARSN